MKPMTDPVSPSELRERFDYDPDTGIMIYKPFQDALGRWNNRNVGKVATKPHKHGYLTIVVQGRTYLAHRAVWALMTGKWPVETVDLKNGIRDDIRWDNLREATPVQQQFNHPVRKDNKLGVAGVRLADNGSYEAAMYIDGKNTYLGRFKTLEEAVAARQNAEKHHRGDWVRRAVI